MGGVEHIGYLKDGTKNTHHSHTHHHRNNNNNDNNSREQRTPQARIKSTARQQEATPKNAQRKRNYNPTLKSSAFFHDAHELPGDGPQNEHNAV